MIPEELLRKKYSWKAQNLDVRLESILKEIQEETGLSINHIRSAVSAQFRFVRDILSLCSSPRNKDFKVETYKSIRLPYIGKFEPKNTFLKRYK